MTISVLCFNDRRACFSSFVKLLRVSLDDFDEATSNSTLCKNDSRATDCFGGSHELFGLNWGYLSSVLAVRSNENV